MGMGMGMDREIKGEKDRKGDKEGCRGGEKRDGISGCPDIYNLYFIFSFKNVN